MKPNQRWERDCFGGLQDLAKVAPEMKLHDAFRLASHMADIELQVIHQGEALAVIAEFFLGFKRGEMPITEHADPAVQWALSVACERHGWVVCGPIRDAMNLLLAKIREEKRGER